MPRIKLFLKGVKIADVGCAQAANAVMRLMNARVNGFWHVSPAALIVAIIAGCATEKVNAPPDLSGPPAAVVDPAENHPDPAALPAPSSPPVVDPPADGTLDPKPTPGDVLPVSPLPPVAVPPASVEDHHKHHRPPIVPSCDRPGT